MRRSKLIYVALRTARNHRPLSLVDTAESPQKQSWQPGVTLPHLVLASSAVDFFMPLFCCFLPSIPSSAPGETFCHVLDASTTITAMLCRLAFMELRHSVG